MIPAPRLTEWIRHAPTPRQHAALLLDHREGLFGGQAGGGKSDYILAAALQFADVPGYSALILRRTFAQLAEPGALLPRAQEWLEGTSAKGADTVNGYPTRWDFPSGAVLSIGHVQHERDRFNYQGAEYQYIGFDELTQFTETIYRYLFSRLRKLSGVAIPLRVRGASNPGGVGHSWVKARFGCGAGMLPAEGAFFLRSTLADNPHLDADEYRESLGYLFDYERAQLEHGDWDAQPPGTILQRDWFQVIDTLPPLKREARFWDLAGTKPADQNPEGGPAWTVGAYGGEPASGEFDLVIGHIDRFRENPDVVKARILQRAHLDGPRVAIRQEQEPGSSGKSVVWDMRSSLKGYDYRGIPSTGDKIARARPFVAAASQKRIAIVRGDWNEAFLSEMEGVSIPPTGFMDQFDSCASLYTECTLGTGVSWSDLYPGEAA